MSDKQPLSQFTCFSKLPAELRLEIFKLALPKSTSRLRWIKVLVKNIHITKNDQLTVTFTIPQGIQGPREEWLDNLYDIRLLKTCKESQTVFLKRFKNHLQTRRHGKIRFDDEATVYIDNYGRLLRNKYFEQAMTSHSQVQLPDWFNGMKGLALHVWDIHGMGDIPNTCGKFIGRFRNLKSLVVVDEYGVVLGSFSSPHVAALASQFFQGVDAWLKAQAKIDGNFRAPQLSLVKVKPSTLQFLGEMRVEHLNPA